VADLEKVEVPGGRFGKGGGARWQVGKRFRTRGQTRKKKVINFLADVDVPLF